jgi:hypothetical protein
MGNGSAGQMVLMTDLVVAYHDIQEIVSWSQCVGVPSGSDSDRTITAEILMKDTYEASSVVVMTCLRWVAVSLPTGIGRRHYDVV